MGPGILAPSCRQLGGGSESNVVDTQRTDGFDKESDVNKCIKVLQQMFKGISRCTCALILEYSRIRRIKYLPHPRL